MSASGFEAIVCGLDGMVATINARNGTTSANQKLRAAAYALGYAEGCGDGNECTHDPDAMSADGLPE